MAPGLRMSCFKCEYTRGWKRRKRVEGPQTRPNSHSKMASEAQVGQRARTLLAARVVEVSSGMVEGCDGESQSERGGHQAEGRAEGEDRDGESKCRRRRSRAPPSPTGRFLEVREERLRWGLKLTYIDVSCKLLDSRTRIRLNRNERRNRITFLAPSLRPHCMGMRRGKRPI